MARCGEKTRFDDVWREEAPILTIDDFCRDNDVDRLNFIKTGIEGWEIRMLFRRRADDCPTQAAVLVELVDEFLQRTGNKADEAFDLLKP